MSSIWRPVDFDSLGSTAVQEGDDSVISTSDEEKQAKHHYDTSASDGKQNKIWIWINIFNFYEKVQWNHILPGYWFMWTCSPNKST